MYYLATRGLVAAVLAVAALIGSWLWLTGQRGDSSAAFGKVLQKTAAADTLELQVTRDGKTGSAWLRGGKELRWNLPDGTYQIARDGKLWLIDEKANRAATQPTSYFGEQPGQELLAILNVAPQKELLAAKPAERVQVDGRTFDVYRWEMPDGTVKVRVEGPGRGRYAFAAIVGGRPRGPGPTRTAGEVDRCCRNKPVAEELFVVGDTLTEDGRIGKVTDVQGTVALRPATAVAGRPLAERMLVRWATGCGPMSAVPMPCRCACSSRPSVVLGPGTLVELVKPNQIRVADGECKIVAAKKAPVEVAGPDGQKVTVEDKRIYRVQDGKLVRLDKEPLWLRGYEGKTQQRIDRLAGGQGRRPRRAADGRLSQGHGRYPRPDRPDHDRGVVRQSHRRPAGGRLPFPACRRTPRLPASACGSATSWSRPTWSRRSGPARSTRPSSARTATPACWNGPAATSSRPACSPSSPIRKSASRSPTPRCCRSRGARTATIRLAKRAAEAASAPQLEIDVKVQFSHAAA